MRKSVIDLGDEPGFTLLELSIVLVIIGLIVGGITVGADMIRSAELRAVITEHQRYKTAVFVFKDKYFALPGDIDNATKFWGVAHATPSVCGTTPSTGTETCDGDDDGEIESTLTTDSSEIFRFWQHLANAGLIEGNYNGVAGSGGWFDAELTGDVNVPSSKLSSAGWTMMYLGNYTGISSYFQGLYNNFFIFGAPEGVGWTSGAVLTAEEAWGLDKKIDDGKPAKGEVWSFIWSGCTDASNWADFNSDYNLDNEDVACSLAFMNQF